MLKRPLVPLVFLVVLACATAVQAQMLLSGAGPALGCAGSPSPDGCVIVPLGAASSAIATDRVVGTWQFVGSAATDGYGNTQVSIAGSPSHFLTEVAIAGGGHAFNQLFALKAPNLVTIFYPNSGGPYQVSGVGAALPPKQFSIGATTYQSLADAINNAVSGNTITVAAMPGGIPAYTDLQCGYSGCNANVSNLTIHCNSGVIFSGTVSGSVGTFNGGPGMTINGCEVSWLLSFDFNGPFRAVNQIKGLAGTTLQNVYFHDNDFGYEGGGDGGTVTVTGSTFEHNGNTSANITAASHNFYQSVDINPVTNVSTDYTTLVISNSKFACTGNNDSSTAGYQDKMRTISSTITNSIFSTVPQVNTALTDCEDTAAIDVTCGGAHNLGGAGVGQGLVIEVGGSNFQGVSAVRFMRDAVSGVVPGAGCPQGGWGGATNDCGLAGLGSPCASVLQNCWVINDTGIGTLTVVSVNTSLGNPATFTVKNCKIVGFAGLGSGVTDGGGNTSFANRSAAGLSACSSLASCPLPSPP